MKKIIAAITIALSLSILYVVIWYYRDDGDIVIHKKLAIGLDDNEVSEILNGYTINVVNSDVKTKYIVYYSSSQFIANRFHTISARFRKIENGRYILVDAPTVSVGRRSDSIMYPVTAFILKYLGGYTPNWVKEVNEDCLTRMMIRIIPP
jgi:hypothetical protein